MDKAICNNPILPLRTSPAHRAEMCDQIVFGEAFQILENKGSWHYIRRIPDHYEGWIEGAHFVPVSPEQADSSSRRPGRVVTRPFLQLIRDDRPIWIPGGARLPFFDASTGSFTLGPHRYSFSGEAPAAITHPREQTEQLAKGYLNAPYLWGGKTIFGIDCSGFTQLILRMCGYELPRDSPQQVDHGRVLDFIMDARPGDLAFFGDEEGTIVHTGIMLGPDRIIHASGKVRIDPIDQQGIYNRQQKKYTHKLRVIKNILYET